MAKQPRISVLQLDPGCPLDRFEDWLADTRVRFGVVSLWDHDVPQLASSGDGIIVLGGRMSAHDQSHHPWLEPLSDLLADAHSIDLPILGLCLGHQVLAETLGGAVTVGAEGGPEDGPAELVWTDAAASDPLFGGLVADGLNTVAMSHHDVVTELPPDAVELARTARFPHAAFRLGSSWGVQFHPEASPDLVASWYRRSARKDTDALVEGLRTADGDIRASGRALAHAFVDIVRG